MPRLISIPLMLVLVVLFSCRKKQQPQVPPPPEIPPLQRAGPEKPELAAPEQIIPEPPPTEPETKPEQHEPPPLPEPEPEPPPQVVEPKPEQEPPPPLPSLAPLLTPEQQRRYRSQINASLARARRNLGMLAGRDLDTDQQTRLNRVRTFIHQADSMIATDLAAAAGLARRADILSAELVESTK